MSALTDVGARRRALSDLGSSLLIEAAAGTGKTALLAGRVVALLAAGTDPASIAAITFTDFAASELGSRVHRYVTELLAGGMPEPLRIAWPAGLDAAQRATLRRAAERLDGITATTIHSFCQGIICSHAVEADVDPGAQVLDAAAAAATFDSVFERWLRRRLGGPAEASDPIATVSRVDPLGISKRLKDLARFRLKHRGAAPPAADLEGRPDIDLSDAVSDFRRWVHTQPPEPDTLGLVVDLETLADHFAGSFATRPDFPTLWRLAHPCPLASMRPRAFELKRPRLQGAWKRAVGADRGPALCAEAERLFTIADGRYRTILGRVATALCASLSAELDEVLRDYTERKRAAAVLDFDDLLELARALVRAHEPVRLALGRRFRHILVDEFQDTDPMQAEILFRIAADDMAPRWQDGRVRAGALFAVGDPKQSVYRFRRADIACYVEARAAFERRWPGSVLRLAANFRSRPGIIQHVNLCFARPLSALGQPGYAPLEATLGEGVAGMAAVQRLTVQLAPDTAPNDVRDAEAEAVADACSRLVGALPVRSADGTVRPLLPGDIALLAPVGTELWRYERALEARGLPLASQAGRGLFRRQEAQDIVALVRALADADDTLAFGAVMRGPLVGLTDEELLDVAGALPRPLGEATPSRFTIATDPTSVDHPIARRALTIMSSLRRKVRATTPAALLAEAAEQLGLAPIMAAREGGGQRALANIEALIERARSYDVAGLDRFARDLSRDWSIGVPCDEGRLDADGDAIELITIHSAKGSEWPVVIPINGGTRMRAREPFVHRADDDTLHWLIGEVVPPDLEAALRLDEGAEAQQRERLLYVACTRARELLLLPALGHDDARCWARILDMNHGDLPEFLPTQPPRSTTAPMEEMLNAQTAEAFAAERRHRRCREAHGVDLAERGRPGSAARRGGDVSGTGRAARGRRRRRLGPHQGPVAAQAVRGGARRRAERSDGRLGRARGRSHGTTGADAGTRCGPAGSSGGGRHGMADPAAARRRGPSPEAGPRMALVCHPRRRGAIRPRRAGRCRRLRRPAR
jgi:CRISPR-associated exonuclease Cas4